MTILVLLQVTVVLAAALYLVKCRSNMRRRHAESWDSLLTRLSPEWSARELSDQFLWKEGINGSPEDTWKQMRGPKGLWIMHQNARVMMDMADYAARNSESVDPLLIETLRSDAIQIRICVLVVLAQYAFSHAGERVRIDAFRAASMYTGMAARMTQLLRANAAMVLPDFVAAM